MSFNWWTIYKPCIDHIPTPFQSFKNMLSSSVYPWCINKPAGNHDIDTISIIYISHIWVNIIYNDKYGGFLSHRATPSHHLFYWEFPFTKTIQRTWGTPISGHLHVLGPKPHAAGHRASVMDPEVLLTASVQSPREFWSSSENGASPAGWRKDGKIPLKILKWMMTGDYLLNLWTRPPFWLLKMAIYSWFTQW